MEKTLQVFVAGVTTALLAATPAPAVAPAPRPMHAAHSVTTAADDDARATLPRRNSRIVFLETTPPGGGEGRRDIFTIRRDGTDQKRLTFSKSNHFPQWGPSGRQILFVRNNPSIGDRLWVMNADGTSKQRVPGTRVGDSEPSWAPGGHRFVFTRTYPDTETQLFVYSFGTMAVRPLTRRSKNSPNVRDPAWSPNGRRIVFVRTRHDYTSTDLFTIRANGTGLKRLTFTPRQWEGQPDWAPQGGRLVLSRRGETSNCGGLFTMHADGSHLQRVRAGCTPESPAWSPDGSKLAVWLETPNRRGIWIMSPDGSARRFLVSGDTPDW